MIEPALRDGAFVIRLYDEDAKKEIPAAAAQELTVTEKTSGKKLAVEKKDGRWSLPKPAGKDFWLARRRRTGCTSGGSGRAGSSCSGAAGTSCSTRTSPTR